MQISAPVKLTDISIAVICTASAYVFLICRTDGQFPYYSICSTSKTLQETKFDDRHRFKLISAKSSQRL